MYERELAYNPETRKTFTVGKRLLGKIPAGQHEIVPTRPKKAVGVNKELRVNANKLVHLGSPWNAALTFKKKYRSSRKP